MLASFALATMLFVGAGCRGDAVPEGAVPGDTPVGQAGGEDQSRRAPSPAEVAPGPMPLQGLAEDTELQQRLLESLTEEQQAELERRKETQIIIVPDEEPTPEPTDPTIPW